MKNKSEVVMELLTETDMEKVPFYQLVLVYKDIFFLSLACASRSLRSVLRRLERIKKISIYEDRFDFYIMLIPEK